jgi:hypothetical protein
MRGQILLLQQEQFAERKERQERTGSAARVLSGFFPFFRLALFGLRPKAAPSS